MGRRGVSQAAAALAAAHAGDIDQPPSVRLREGDLPIWQAVTRARARVEWTTIDLHHAANLVRCLSDIERLSEELRSEGDVIVNARGTQVANAKHALLGILSSRAVGLTRLLALHARALKDPRLREPLRQAEREARRDLEDRDADDLLALPPKLR